MPRELHKQLFQLTQEEFLDLLRSLGAPTQVVGIAQQHIIAHVHSRTQPAATTTSHSGNQNDLFDLFHSHCSRADKTSCRGLEKIGK